MKKLFLFINIIALLSGAISCKKDSGEMELPSIAYKALTDTTSIYYGNYKNYPKEIYKLPIGIFDASTDAFCVLEKFLTMDKFNNITGKMKPDGIADFGGENFQYLADNANGPYRAYLPDNEPFLKELILKSVIFLMGRSYYNLNIDDFKSGVKEPVKCIILASNIGSVTSSEDVSNFIKKSGTGVVVVETMEAGIRDMLENMNSNENYSIGILSPEQIITPREYEAIIRKKAAEEGIRGVLQIFNQEAVGLDQAIIGNSDYIDTKADSVRDDYKGPTIGISYNNIDLSLMDRYNFDMSNNALLYKVNNGKYTNIQLNSVGNYVRYHLVSLMERHRRSGSKIPISSIILSSYRYHQVKDILNKVIKELYDYNRDGIYLYRNSISPDFRFIDPVECAAIECYLKLRESGKLALRAQKTELSAFISVPSYDLPEAYLNPDGSLTDSIKLHRVPGTDDIITKIVPFAPRYVDSHTMSAIVQRVPNTYSLIRNTLF